MDNLKAIITEVIEKHPDTISRLHEVAKFMLYPDLECEVTKILHTDEAELTNAEKISVPKSVEKK